MKNDRAIGNKKTCLSRYSARPMLKTDRPAQTHQCVGPMNRRSHRNYSNIHQKRRRENKSRKYFRPIKFQVDSNLATQ
jgi:hypothetical protein